jgi:hypothetical protein
MGVFLFPYFNKKCRQGPWLFANPFVDLYPAIGRALDECGVSKRNSTASQVET